MANLRNKATIIAVTLASAFSVNSSDTIVATQCVVSEFSRDYAESQLLARLASEQYNSQIMGFESYGHGQVNKVIDQYSSLAVKDVVWISESVDEENQTCHEFRIELL